ncbi:hypothetical protein Desku_2064 [Desulfofundulus kuznetsovii DSM 6115]|jgi:NAD-dependent SIR2 family protein deacetylase|uniref:Deacetylase sirtuin-type domain-containing protein n=1 Tax=Desulfofundulus kuznetsovii (strain DSM 6115 / VKM B-1805 / 17) TaxID=760568 RepID=A0AAU8PC18_DESK7|nr:hypothetical protein Desku_2064 [Desulfofundulus kuznetsovii DSM 6115]
MTSGRAEVKVAIVTGAGFSLPAGIPTQRELLYQIERFEPDIFQPGYLKFVQAKRVVNRFLRTIFLRDPDKDERSEQVVQKLGNLQLEDIYSILDRAISKGDVLPPFSETELVNVRDALDRCIMYYLNYLETNLSPEKQRLYERLYHKLLTDYGNDWIVISTNWDTVWDEVILSICRQNNLVLDYGPNIFWIELDGTAQRPEGGRLGPRLLKLHGSFNWLTCPQCHTIFVWPKGLGVRDIFDPVRCPRCCAYPIETIEPLLRPLFLTPSLLKSVKNPTLELIWDEAFCALRTAKEVIFIGYSLPLADHDLRYLLRRSISQNTKVKVILHESDRPVRAERNTSCPEFRYKSLLDLFDTDFYYEGFESFFSIGA